MPAPQTRTNVNNASQRTPEELLRRRTLLQSWKVLSPNTRLALSFGLLAFAYGGLKLSDYLQQEYPQDNDMPKIVEK